MAARTDEPSGGGVLRRAITGQWRSIALSTVLAGGHQAGEAMVPVLIGLIINNAIRTGEVRPLIGLLAALAVTFAVLSYSFRFGARAAEKAAERAGHELRLDVTRRVIDPRGGADTGRLSGALANIATQDARRVGEVNSTLPFWFAALVGVLVSAVLLLRISVPLGLLVLLGTPPLLLLAHLIGKPLERRSGDEQERAAHASGLAADLVSGLRVLKGIGAETAAIARYRVTSQDSLGATLRAARAQAWHNGAILTLNGVFIAIVALVGGRLAAAGEISIGGLVAALGLAQFLLGPLEMFAWANGALAQGRASAKRIAAVLASPPLLATGTDAPATPVRGALRLDGVSHPPLRDLSFGVAPGELIGVVAPDPAAATALLACLARDVDPAAGAVELDGRRLSTLDPSGVRTVILLAAHDADLFEGTLLENVTASGVGARGHEPALAAATADEVASTLPHGTSTILAERGSSLSGGQRQRVALARALAADPAVLLLHDPTTAVDTMTETAIAAALRELRHGRTTVLVTTSPALLAVTDRVIVIEDGAVSAEGSHAELVRDRESYRAAVLA